MPTYTVDQPRAYLVSACEAAGLRKTGNKDELVARLNDMATPPRRTRSNESGGSSKAKKSGSDKKAKQVEKRPTRSSSRAKDSSRSKSRSRGDSKSRSKSRSGRKSERKSSSSSAGSAGVKGGDPRDDDSLLFPWLGRIPQALRFR